MANSCSQKCPSGQFYQYSEQCYCGGEYTKIKDCLKDNAAPTTLEVYRCLPIRPAQPEQKKGCSAACPSGIWWMFNKKCYCDEAKLKIDKCLKNKGEAMIKQCIASTEVSSSGSYIGNSVGAKGKYNNAEVCHKKTNCAGNDCNDEATDGPKDNQDDKKTKKVEGTIVTAKEQTLDPTKSSDIRQVGIGLLTFTSLVLLLL